MGANSGSARERAFGPAGSTGEGRHVPDARQPRVTVVIPAYNQARYLGDALESVLAQTFRGFEIVVVDDGSTDETPTIIDHFSRRARDMQLPLRGIWQENQGLAGARNTGIEHARGELVGLLDSDDAWQPDYLQKMVAMADAHPEAQVFYCQVVYMDEQGEPLPQKAGILTPPSEAIYWILLRKNFLVPSTILMRRQPAIDAGMFDPDFRRLQDWEFWLRLLQGGATFRGLSERLVRYRLHGASLSTDPSGGQSAALAMVKKLFGADEGNPRDWPRDKRRAYGGVYRYHLITAVQYGSQWAAAAGYLQKALRADPSLAEDLDLFYELALGSQPLGVRGTAIQPEIERNAARLDGLLQDTFAPPLAPEWSGLRLETESTAYRAIALVAYNLGTAALARRYLWRAVQRRPGLLLDAAVIKLFLKLLLGDHNLAFIRQLLSKSNQKKEFS